MLNNNSNFAKELFEGLNNKEQEEILGQMLSKQHNIINDLRNTDTNTDTNDNFLEPIVDLVFNAIKLLVNKLSN